MTQAIGNSRMERRAALLAVVILVQALTGVFFFGDVVVDYMKNGKLDELHMWLELVASIALMAGVIFLMIELRRVMTHMAGLETAMRAARGEMSQVIGAFFDDWGLTPSERDVGLMVIKGIDNETIATMRGTARGTVRAQCTAIYGKAGVDGRAQLISLFVEELLAGPEELVAAQ